MENKQPQIVLIGAGIMSATLAVLIHELMPQAQIKLIERMDRVAAESSDAWNNAGTGHAAYCELNYTPQREDGSVDISKALDISEQFEISKQFWSYLVKDLKIVDNPSSFINNIDHLSFVWGEENVEYLKARHEAMSKHAIFEDMAYTEDQEIIKKWVPLLFKQREHDIPMAATKMDLGTDVNFGNVTKAMIDYLASFDNVEVVLDTEVNDIERKNEKWLIETKHRSNNNKFTYEADFIFIGAGGGSLPLLDKADIPEAKGYGGFPVGGIWLKCTNGKIINEHYAKVYGKAEVGAPPMSVPHLDTRIINGERALLFGPYAGFSTKFLKNGSYADLFLSIEMHNIWPMLSAGINNVPLTKYLIEQVVQSKDDKIEALQKFYPGAKEEYWVELVAGQRVQVIKKENGKGVLKFGTEVVCNQDGSLATLLGASPGASTAVSIMLDVLSKCFSSEYQSEEWELKLKKMIPSFGTSLIQDRSLLHKVRKQSNKILGLNE